MILIEEKHSSAIALLKQTNDELKAKLEEERVNQLSESKMNFSEYSDLVQKLSDACKVVDQLDDAQSTITDLKATLELTETEKS